MNVHRLALVDESDIPLRQALRDQHGYRRSADLDRKQVPFPTLIRLRRLDETDWLVLDTATDALGANGKSSLCQEIGGAEPGECLRWRLAYCRTFEAGRSWLPDFGVHMRVPRGIAS